MTRETLLALAERVESAEGPDYDLEIEIFKAIHPEYAGYVQGRGGLVHPCDGSDQRVLSDVRPGNYTRSLDAAMTLVDAEAYWRVGHDGEGRDPSMFAARVFDPLMMKRPATAVCETAALTLCAAALRARAACLVEGKAS